MSDRFRLTLTIKDIQYKKEFYENNKVFLATKYLFNGQKEYFFIDSFDIILCDLNQRLFKSVIITFSNCKNGLKLFGETIIHLNRYFLKDNKLVKFNNSEISIQDTFDIIKLEHHLSSFDYYIEEREILGTVTIECKFKKIKKVENTFQNNFVTSFIQKHLGATSNLMVNTVISNLDDLVNSSTASTIRYILGSISAAKYYFKTYGRCKEIDCNQLCENPFCKHGYTAIDKNMANKISPLVQESIAPFLNHPAGWVLKKLRSCPHVKDEIERHLLERSNITAEQIVKYSKLTVTSPNYIAFYRESDMFGKNENVLIVSFRGTTGLNDAIINLNCQYEEYEDGFVHAGFYNLSKSFIKNEWEVLKMRIEKKGIDKVLFIGYSLGAAIASMVNIILTDRGESCQMKTVGFGCPPIISKNMNNYSIQLYTYKFDITSRLCYGSVLDLKFLLVSMCDIFEHLKSNTNMIFKMNKIRNYIKENNINPKLYLPGKLFHIHKFNNVYKIKEVVSEFYDEIVFCGYVGSNHLISKMGRAFNTDEL